MNGQTGKFRRQFQKLLLCAGGALALAGCVELPKIEPYSGAAINPNSAAAAEVARAAANPGPYPTFEDIPPFPADMRAPAAWRSAVQATEADRVTLLAETAPETWALNDSDGFVARTLADADVDWDDVPTEADIAESEAFARSLRARAIPPPRPR